MNWEAIQAISGLLSAIAVVATLGYVAVQIRQNTKSLRSAVPENRGAEAAGWRIRGPSSYERCSIKRRMNAVPEST